mmetsp:Transcript_22504/g.29207  ORF Transcript_22504/g.29207 Transcript_22504/m.29207 type:complete len:81 (-) Transcript_22504:1516-1758(-)
MKFNQTKKKKSTQDTLIHIFYNRNDIMPSFAFHQLALLNKMGHLEEFSENHPRYLWQVGIYEDFSFQLPPQRISILFQVY